MGTRRWLVPPPPHTCPLRQIYNLGTGTGYSVLQMVQAMEKASGRKVDHLPCPAHLTLGDRPGPSHSPTRGALPSTHLLQRSVPFGILPCTRTSIS